MLSIRKFRYRLIINKLADGLEKKTAIAISKRLLMDGIKSEINPLLSVMIAKLGLIWYFLLDKDAAIDNAISVINSAREIIKSKRLQEILGATMECFNLLLGG